MNLSVLWSNIIAVLRRRGWIIALVLILGLPAVVLYALSRPLLFEATAVIQIESPQVTPTLTGAATAAPTQNRLELIEQKLMSRDSLVAIISELGLFPAVAGEEVSLTGQVAILRESVSIIKLVDPTQSWRPDVQPSGLAITVRLGDPQQAADVANAFLANILNEAQSRSEGRAARTLDFFVAEEARVGAEIAALETSFARFKEQNAAALPEGLDSQRTQMLRLVESRIAMDQQIIELQTPSDRLRAEEIARQTNRLEQQRALIVQNIAAIQTALDAAPEVERQFSAFERELAQLQEEFRMVTTRRSEAAMNQLLESQDQSERFEVLETALVPEFPVSASRKKLAAAGGVVVGVVALALALAIEFLNPAIRTAAQLERQLGVQPVVVIPVLRTVETVRRRRLLWLSGLIALLAALVLGLRDRWGNLLDTLPFLQRSPIPVLQDRRR